MVCKCIDGDKFCFARYIKLPGAARVSVTMRHRKNDPTELDAPTCSTP